MRVALQKLDGKCLVKNDKHDNIFSDYIKELVFLKTTNKPLGTNGPRDKNDSDKNQDIRMPYAGNGYV